MAQAAATAACDCDQQINQELAAIARMAKDTFLKWLSKNLSKMWQPEHSSRAIA